MSLKKCVSALYLILFGFNSFSQDGVTFDTDITVGAERVDSYLPDIKSKRIAIVGNQTSMVGKQHLVDTLISLGVAVKKVFAPEHGFRGMADAGAWIKDGKDEKTGVPVVSMYGKYKKPSAESLADVDIILFDIQDVGARFYTYISSMHYVMEAAAESGKQVIILDRPNPNGHYVDGPVLESSQESFIGMHPVPIVHGMTIGEYAQMINGENWLKNKVKCDLKVIECENYDHTKFYEVPIKPSPNLPNMSSIYMYPSVCLFEGTNVSVGRGTNKPFQIIGKPNFPKGDYKFTPVAGPGSKYPKHKNVECQGYDLSEFGWHSMRDQRKIYLHWLVGMYRDSNDKESFFKKSGSFYLLCGNKKIKQMLVEGKSAEEIEASWQDEVKKFKLTRQKYLLYKDFE